MQEQLLTEILSELRQINTHLALLPQLLARPFEVEIVNREAQREFEAYLDYFTKLGRLKRSLTQEPTTSIQPAEESAAPLAVETTPPSDGAE